MSIIIKSGNSQNTANVTPAGAIQVDGSAVTQPVSLTGTTTIAGSVAVSNFPATQPVSAASLPLPANAAMETGGNLALLAGAVSAGKLQVNAGTVPVTGTFFPATQPVSAAALPLPANAAQETGGNLATLSGTVSAGKVQVNATGSSVSVTGSVAVTGTFFQATQPVSGTVSVANFPATQPVSIAATVATTQVGGASALVGDVQAKGVQGVNGLVTQDFKDSGRVIKTFTAAFTAATTEALITLTPNSDGATGTAGVSFTVTAGKRFRITAIMLTCFNATAAIHACQVNLRMSNSGAVTTSSPIVASIAVTTAAATANLSASQGQGFPDGLELSGTMQFGVSQIGIALAGQTVTLMGYEY